MFSGTDSGHKKIILSDFLDKVKSKEIKSIDIKGTTIYGVDNNDEKFVVNTTFLLNQSDTIKELKEDNVKISVTPTLSLIHI